MSKIKCIPLLITFFLIFNLTNAQVERRSDLFQKLKATDSLLFQIGFNQCKLSQFEELLSEDFEYYHDQGGIDPSKEAFMETMRNGLCSTGINSTRRELVEKSLEVYPLGDEGFLYGAIQTGVHRFGQTTAKFTHLWLLEKGEWKLARVLSYNHVYREQ